MQKLNKTRLSRKDTLQAFVAEACLGVCYWDGDCVQICGVDHNLLYDGIASADSLANSSTY